MVISKKNQSENRVTFDKNWNSSSHMAEYRHNSCLKCPPFARMHTRVHATQLHCQWWSGQCYAKHAENDVSVYNTRLDKIVWYLERIFNRNRKLKQVSKISALKLGVRSKCVQNLMHMLHVGLHFLPYIRQNSNFWLSHGSAATYWMYGGSITWIYWKFISLSSSERILKIR